MFEDEEDTSALARLVFLNCFAWFVLTYLSRRGEFADPLDIDFFGLKEMEFDIEFGLFKFQGSFLWLRGELGL